MTESGKPHDFVYVHTDIPEGMTIRGWRAAQRDDRRATLATRARVRTIARILRTIVSCFRAGEVRHSSGAHGTILP